MSVIRDTEVMRSYSWYVQYVRQEVEAEIDGGDALTKEGRAIYNSKGRNFGMECGD